MITLYNVPVSSYGAKVRIILVHKGIEWTELAPPDGYGSSAYRAIIPSGTVPAIIDGDLKLADSEAIAEYLDEHVPAPPMMPADPESRARAREAKEKLGRDGMPLPRPGASPLRANAWATSFEASPTLYYSFMDYPANL